MVELQQLRAELECEKYRVSQLERENDELKNKLKQANEEIDSLSFKIKQELEPRLKQEAQSYDGWVSSDRAAEACEYFGSKVEELVDMVKESPEYFSFENADGDVVERVLYTIKKGLYLD